MKNQIPWLSRNRRQILAGHLTPGKMKPIILSALWIALCAGVLIPPSARCGISVDTNTGLPIQTTNDLDLTFQNLIDSTRVPNGQAEQARETAWQYQEQKQRTVSELLSLMRDPQATKINRATAAFYLGELHAEGSLDILAQNITLQLDKNDLPLFHGMGMLAPLKARDALVKIGTPSIPALIRNLSTSDDTTIREFSLQTLCRIENDNDVVKLRLEKALKTESAPQKQARLQAALKSLAEMKPK